jgi:hypothetical protein
MNVRRYAAWPALVVALSVPALMDCSAAKNAQELAEGCDEFSQGPSAVASLKLDASVQGFVQAAADLKAQVDSINADVLAACSDIATQLGATNTWSALMGSDAISNGQMTGACDQANVQINAIMSDPTIKASAHVALTITPPVCTVTASVQASCEANCNVDASCTPGMIDVTARCDPGQLSVQCEGMCNASAVCEGSVEAAANCQGTCSATCNGQCTGTCTAEAGSQTMNDAACMGKCSGTCTGTCTGECKIDANANVTCGANVSCRGGCTGTATAPKCEGEIKALPPECHADADCEASCQGQAQAAATCTEGKVTLAVDTSVDARLVTLKTALEANLPKLILAAESKGKLVADAIGNVANAGTALVAKVTANVSTVGGKAVACAKAAGEASVNASASVSVSVHASASVEGSASGSSS